jgi:hypothetical protein
MPLRSEERRPSERLYLDDVVDGARGEKCFHRARKSNRGRDEDIDGIAERLRFNSSQVISRW